MRRSGRTAISHQPKADAGSLKRTAARKDNRSARPAVNRFLTQKLSPFTRFECQSQLTDEVYEELMDSLRAYCRIASVPFPEPQGGYDNVGRLASTLKAVNGEMESWERTFYINLEKSEEGHLSLVYGKDMITNGWTMFFLPIQKTYGNSDKVSAEFGKIVRRYIRTLMNENGLDDITDTRTFNYLEEMIEDDPQTYSDAEDGDYMECDAIACYKEGEAKTALTELAADVRAHPFSLKELEDYTPSIEESPLYDLLFENTDLIFHEKPITEYCGMLCEDMWDGACIAIDDVVVLNYYQTESEMEEMYVDMLNSESDSGADQMMLIGEKTLTPYMTDLEVDDYPTRFMEFINTLCEMLYNL